MALLVCAPTPKELSALVPDLFPHENEIAEMQPKRGSLKGQETIFLCTGVGPINAALSIGVCLGLVHPEGGNHVPIKGIIFAGLAGAFDLAVTPLCSICEVTREIWPEYGLNDGAAVTAAAFSYPLWAPPGQAPIYESLKLAGLAELPISIKTSPDWAQCASLTVAGVTASFARREALWNAWHAELENMEGFAAAYAAARAEIPLVELRAVSNKVGPRAKHEKDFAGALQALSAILPALDLD